MKFTPLLKLFQLGLALTALIGIALTVLKFGETTDADFLRLVPQLILGGFVGSTLVSLFLKSKKVAHTDPLLYTPLLYLIVLALFLVALQFGWIRPYNHGL